MRQAMLLYVLFYMALTIVTIDFPPVFIDEPWLGEVSFNLVQNGELKTTSFPYSQNYMLWLGNLFILMNALSVKVFGFNIFALRLFSVLFFGGSMFLLYSILKKLFNEMLAFTFVIVFSLSPFTVNMARMVRPESFIVFLFLLGLYLVFTFDKSKPKKAMLLGLIFSLPGLIHIVGLFTGVIGFILLLKHPKALLYYILGAVPSGAIFIYKLNGNLEFYVNHGQKTGTFEISLIKVQKYLAFLYQGFDVTSYLIIFFMLLAIPGIIKIYKQKQIWCNYQIFFISFMTLAVLIFVIFNLSRLYLVYFLLFLLVLLLVPLYQYKKSVFLTASLTLSLLFIYQNVLWFNYFKTADYGLYEQELRKVIPQNSSVLGKINYKLSFPDGKYFASEDLIYFIEDGGSVKEYIDRYNIGYIVYDYAWDYQNEIRNYLANNTQLIYAFNEKFYSNRLGPTGSMHIWLPYYNLIEVSSSNQMDKAMYWTKVYKINKRI